MADPPALDFESILTFRQLIEAYDRLIEVLENSIMFDHPEHNQAADSLTDNGRRFLTDTERHGHDIVLALESKPADGTFFVVINERAKPGGSGSSISAERTLRIALGPPVRRLALFCAQHQTTTRHNLEGPDLWIREEPEQLPETVSQLAAQERQRLLGLLNPDW